MLDSEACACQNRVHMRPVRNLSDFPFNVFPFRHKAIYVLRIGSL